MTPEERAWMIAEEIRALAREGGLSDVPIINRIAAVIREAVAAEREACARLADEMGTLRKPVSDWTHADQHASKIAALIRARSNA